jgi:hypothetical protein
MSADLTALMQAAAALVDAVELDEGRSGGLLSKLTLRRASELRHAMLAVQVFFRLSVRPVAAGVSPATIVRLAVGVPPAYSIPDPSRRSSDRAGRETADEPSPAAPSLAPVGPRPAAKHPV